MTEGQRSLSEVDAVLTAPGAPFEMVTLDGRDPPVRGWAHFPTTMPSFIDAIAQRHAEREALVLDERRVSYTVLVGAACTLARHLAEYGIRPGDRVAIAMRNCLEWPIAFFGTALAGAVAVPLNSWWTGDELGFALDDSGARLLIADEERQRRVGSRPGTETWLAGSDKAPGSAWLHDLIGAPADCGISPTTALDSPALPDDDLAILYTSGTSGRPKGAIVSHRNMLSCIGSMRYLAARAALRASGPIPAFEPKVCLLSVPLFHVTALAANLIPQLFAGSKIVLMSRWEAGKALALIERERVTVGGGVPTIVQQLLDHPDRGKYDLSSLEVLTYGGAAAPSHLPGRIGDETPAVPGNGWGMTETSATVTGHFGADYAARPHSAGPAVPVYDLRIVADGRDVPVGQAGELWVRGPGVVRGYWNRPDATDETFVDGWLRTGDLARIDADGFLTLVDRIKDVVIRGGENIYSVEVEDALKRQPGVLDAALVGQPDAILGEVPVAVIQVAEGVAIDTTELREALARSLAAYKLPIFIHVQMEALPRNANGKLMKTAIKAELGMSEEAIQ